MFKSLTSVQDEPFHCSVFALKPLVSPPCICPSELLDPDPVAPYLPVFISETSVQLVPFQVSAVVLRGLGEPPAASAEV